MNKCFASHLYNFLITIALLMVGCSTDPKNLEDKSAEEFYNKALEHLKNQEFLSAAKSFDHVEQYHPYSRWATKSQIMSSYCYYKSRAYERALEQLDSFIQLHPGHPDIPYAYYLKSYCFYHQISIVERDQKMTELALEALNEIIKRYPNSPYAKDAKLKQHLTKDHLAGKNMDIARFYQKQKLYSAAINRFKTVIDMYQETSHIAEALNRLVECYLSIGLFVEAKKIASVLGHNYPESDWYANTYQLMQTVDSAALEKAIKDLSITHNHKITIPKYSKQSYHSQSSSHIQDSNMSSDISNEQNDLSIPEIDAVTIAEPPPYEQRPVKEVKPDDASKTDIPETA